MPANESFFGALSALNDKKIPMLGVKIGDRVVEPGMHIPKEEARATPEVTFSAATPQAKYVVVCLDPDAPHPSASFLGPILHWMQSGLTVGGAEGGDKLASSEPFISDYAPPGPPGFSPPHRYAFLLYEQPAAFDAKAYAPADGTKMGMWPRMRYSLDEWEKKADAGKVLAANYFVSN